MTKNHTRYDDKANALVVASLTITDPAVLSECRHWAEGRRGDPAETAELASADLSVFAEQAIALGATAMTAASGVQQTYSMDALVHDVEQRSTRAVTAATDQTTAVVKEAARALELASEKTRKTVTDAGNNAQKSFAAAVAEAQTQLGRQLTVLLGGEEPELMAKLQPVLESFSRNLQERAVSQTSSLIEKVAKQFNPADPASPMAQHMRTMNETQSRHAQILTAQNEKLAEKFEELSTGLAVARATDVALARSTAKGATYEEQVHGVMAEVAAGLGDEYVETGNVTGLRTRSKKGDGVLAVVGQGQPAEVRVVVEMTDSSRPNWSSYLAEAEENRGAQASLGLVKRSENLAGGPILCLGPRRIVMAFDPEADEPRLLRCVVQLLRLAAETASARREDSEIATADEQLVEAVSALKRLAKVQKEAGSIRKSADSIDGEVATLHTELTRHLTQARSALAGVANREHDAA